MHRPTDFVQSRILLSVPHMHGGELGYVHEAFAMNWLSTVGPNITAVEEEFASLLRLPAVALSSGTAGIHLGLKVLGIKPGDEVISPTLTFAASCNPVLYEQGVPIFLDSEERGWNISPELLEACLRKRARVNKLPRAAIVVHLFGQSADMDSILDVCSRYEVPVLEDAAESLGARYKGQHPGTLGAVGVFSFNGNKIITGTTGGMLVARDPHRVDQVRKWSTQARDRDIEGLNNYIHSEVGFNYRMSNVVAGIVRGQLQALELRVRQRRAVFERYRKGFENLAGIRPQEEVQYGGDKILAQTSPELQTGTADPAKTFTPAAMSSDAAAPNQHTRWLSCFLIDESEFGMSASDLIRFLDLANVEARPVWKPMHTQPLYRSYECLGGQVAEDLNRRGICLPSSSSLTEESQQFVIDRVCEAHLTGKR